VLQCEPSDTRSVEELLEAADGLMYEEKRLRHAGRAVPGAPAETPSPTA
jgi:hypothetical protein